MTKRRKSSRTVVHTALGLAAASATVVAHAAVTAGAASATDGTETPLDTGERARTAVVWGDSLIVEAASTIGWFGVLGGTDIDVRAHGGTAPCDWLSDIARTASRSRPDVAVLAFSGNNMTNCMVDVGTGDRISGDRLIGKYADDLSAAVDALTSRGVAVILVAPPPLAGRDDLNELRALPERLAAGRSRVYPVDSGTVLAEGGRFASRLPCFPWEDESKGCGPDGKITVRAPDGVHFCPTGAEPNGGCGVYSAGAVRYGMAIDTAIFSV